MTLTYEQTFDGAMNRSSSEHSCPGLREMSMNALSEQANNVTLLDARDEEDCDASSKAPEGSIRVSPSDLAWLNWLERTPSYVVFCDNPECETSQRIALEMVSKGFTNVYLLKATVAELEAFGYAMYDKTQL